MNKTVKIAVVTLGCARNQVDSEIMLGLLKDREYQITADLEEAEAIIVNTCGFLEAASKESVDCILEVAEYKKSGSCRKLIVTGCLVSRYREDLESSLPEVDAFLTTDNFTKVGEVLSSDRPSPINSPSQERFLYDETTPRMVSGLPHMAYLKISEGCNHSCSYCTIPFIRGSLRCRSISSVIDEIKGLEDQGVKEINLVAEDLTAFGSDKKNEGGSSEVDLSRLLEKIDRDCSISRVRLLYTYPTGISERLLDCIQGLSSVCEYIDLPLQHISEKILRGMNRPVGRYASRPLVEWIKSKYPKIHIRTTFIVGFPEEEPGDVDQLEEFILEGHFTGVGVFSYSHEEGTAAYELRDEIRLPEKELRRERLMLAQKKVNDRNLNSLKGNVLEVMIDGLHDESDLLLLGRTRFQAPEVDGGVLINDSEIEDEEVEAGDVASVLVTDTAGYDLVGTVVGK